MQYLQFTNDRGQAIAINPYKIATIQKVNNNFEEPRTQVTLDSGYTITVTMQYEDVLQLIVKIGEEP